MRSPSDDRTARAVIRDESLRLFARRGPDAVTVREIAAAANVSPALVVRHYGSKDGLRAAVDEYVAAVFEAMLDPVVDASASGIAGPDGPPGLAESIAAQLPEGSPIPTYVARMLLTEAGAELFARLHALSRHALDRLVEAGAATDGDDPPARAAFLLATDLAVFMLRDRLAEALGVDPLSPAGLRRWGAQVAAVYRGGLTATPRADRRPPPERGDDR